MRKTTIILALGLAISGVSVINLSAKDAGEDLALASILKSVPAPELPAKAGQLVKQSQAKDKSAITVAVVKSAVEASPAVAPLVVATVSKSVPEMAPIAAGTAAALQPRQAVLIARAAASASPGQAAKIVETVCREVPLEHRDIAVAVAQVVPTAGRDIVEAVAKAIPSMRPAIDHAITVYGGTVPSVGVVLAKANEAPRSQAVLLTQTLPKPPTIGPPYKQPATTPTNIPPGGDGPVVPGGRDYAKP